jgi:hypothetical protein
MSIPHNLLERSDSPSESTPETSNSHAATVVDPHPSEHLTTEEPAQAIVAPHPHTSVSNTTPSRCQSVQSSHTVSHIASKASPLPSATLLALVSRLQSKELVELTSSDEDCWLYNHFPSSIESWFGTTYIQTGKPDSSPVDSHTDSGFSLVEDISSQSSCAPGPDDWSEPTYASKPELATETQCTKYLLKAIHPEPLSQQQNRYPTPFTDTNAQSCASGADDWSEPTYVSESKPLPGTHFAKYMLDSIQPQPLSRQHKMYPTLFTGTSANIVAKHHNQAQQHVSHEQVLLSLMQALQADAPWSPCNLKVSIAIHTS